MISALAQPAGHESAGKERLGAAYTRKSVANLLKSDLWKAAARLVRLRAATGQRAGVGRRGFYACRNTRTIVLLDA
ncbi:hypothetical protein EVAR_37341_1 [Eumeta japonica]|uniref:Uncharacterized protein n=1 Tax=Eumeta variegata TaxID=151549 RepID=A0A4C1WXI8_EUMVA|nr:hypothetical protein EVAR_37341_1 [Eumeta japonica]